MKPWLRAKYAEVAMGSIDETFAKGTTRSVRVASAIPILGQASAAPAPTRNCLLFVLTLPILVQRGMNMHCVGMVTDLGYVEKSGHGLASYVQVRVASIMPGVIGIVDQARAGGHVGASQ